MANVEGIDRVKRAIRQMAARYLDSPNAVKGQSVIVGYTAAYALHVHENLKARHKPGKVAKYLEGPARSPWLRRELANIVIAGCRAGHGILTVLLRAGLRLQRESQKIVPVMTGNLKASAFTRAET